MSSWQTYILVGILSLTHVLAAGSNASVTLPHRRLHSWPDGTWVENIAVRPNGNLLVTTSTPNGSVFQIHEPWKDEPRIELVYTFDDWVDRLIGIGESTPDKYVVVGSRFYTQDWLGVEVANTFVAMELDFSKNTSEPTARLITRMPEAYLLQSVAALPWKRSTVLISDQFLLKPRHPQVDYSPSPGQIWSLDTITGKYDLVMTNYAELNATAGFSDYASIGINGLKVRGQYTYWVNSDLFNVYRIRIDRHGRPWPRDAKPELLAHWPTGSWDDFSFGPGHDDTIWAASLDSAVYAISPKGQISAVAGVGTKDNTSTPGPTATGFGRTSRDRNICYVTGNLKEVPTNPVDGKVGGWVVALDTTGFHF